MRFKNLECRFLQKEVMSNKILSPLVLLALSQACFAQLAPSFAQQPPSAGTLLQQIPLAPVPLEAKPGIEVQKVSPVVTAEQDSATIVVKKLRVTGAIAYSETELLAITGFIPDSTLTLSDLRLMASRIADHYHRNGYFVAQAYLPAQDIKNGTVTIAVMDGQYGKVVLNNTSRVSSNLANNLLGGLKSGDPIMTNSLETRLLLLSDLPGATVKSTLVPGDSLGSSDLIVDLTPGRSVSGSIDADNAGNRYTGANRIGATVNFNELTGQGDVATLRAVTSGPGLTYMIGAYQMQLGKTKLGISYSALKYSLIREFESLESNGTAKVASVYGSYPLIRSRNNNLYIGLAFNAKSFHDRIDSTLFVSDKKANVLVASVYGDHQDKLWGGAVSSYSLNLSNGNMDLQTPSVSAFDAATARSNGHYTKLAYSVARLQNVTDSVSFYAAVNGQLASKNLDPSEKMELGGMYGVRAYPEGEGYADQGYVLNLEARLLLPKLTDQMPGQIQLIAFADTGSVKTNTHPWTGGPNDRTLSGAGVGLTWMEVNNFSLKLYYAFKLGNEVPLSAPDSSGRFWVQAVKYF
jgi:hemolysin activation/secretion protein